MPTPKRDEVMLRAEARAHDGTVRFSVGMPLPLVMELDHTIEKYDLGSRSSFMRRALIAELERERRRRNLC